MKNEKSEYNDNLAYHYKSFRPPLHQILLKRSLKDQKFESALDIGCGTGNSTLELVKYCESVTGYDPNTAMIQRCEHNPKVGFTEKLSDLKENYNLLVFFGSLHYINAKDFSLYEKKLKNGGFLLCTDFEILYDAILAKLELYLTEIDYDHNKNLTSYNSKSFEITRTEKFKTLFYCNLSELTHLLLSETFLRKKLIDKYDSTHLFENLKEDLNSHYPNEKIAVEANQYYSFYKKCLP